MERSSLYRLLALAILVMTAVSCERDPLSTPADELTSLSVRRGLSVQVDRFGRPAINTFFIPSVKKDLFNESAPERDRAQFLDDVIAALIAFGHDAESARALALELLPDVQSYAPGQPQGFPNGRRVEDDVATILLGLIFRDHDALNDDNVDGNDRPFLAVFPYLADPHLP